MVQDVKKAYFFAPARREVYVQIPWEDQGPGDHDKCARLKKSLYGTRDAAANWVDEYTRVLVDEMKFVKGASSPCSFHHPVKNIKIVVHGDDFVSEAPKKELLWLDSELKKFFELKTEILGPEKDETRELRILNRVLRWESEGITWEADQRHAEIIIQQLGLEGSKPLSSPGCKEDTRRDKLAEKRRMRKIEESTQKDGGIYSFEAGRVERRSLTICESEQIMIADGWSPVDPSSGKWSKTFVGALEMPIPPSGRMTRRITRKSDGSLIEDLEVKSTTSEKLMRRQLRRPEDINVIVEVNSMSNDDDDDDDDNDDAVPLAGLEATMYRAVAARINFLSQDRSELLFAAKEVSRHMSEPCRGDLGPMKRIGRFLVGRPRSVTIFRWQDPPSGITAHAPTSLKSFTDSNWAGCKATRKSTSGAAFMHGQHLIKAYSRTQANIALSSAEAELYATVAAASEGLGLKAMAADFGMNLDPFLNVDASAAIGIMQRKGLGKLRHLDTQALWIQDAVRQRRVVVEKVRGTDNPADLMTKHLDGQDMDRMLKLLGVETREGRAEIAPKVISGHEDESMKVEVGSRSATFEPETAAGKDKGTVGSKVQDQKPKGVKERISWADEMDKEEEDKRKRHGAWGGSGGASAKWMTPKPASKGRGSG